MTTLVKYQIINMLCVVDTRKTIGKRIKLARVEAELSQDELAEMLGTTQKALSRWELGKVEIGAITLQRVSIALGKPIEYFYQPFEAMVEAKKVRAKLRKAA